jgi:hypothetical protein
MPAILPPHLALQGKIGKPFVLAYQPVWGNNVAVLKNGLLLNVGSNSSTPPNDIAIQYYTSKGVAQGAPLNVSPPSFGSFNGGTQVTALKGGGFAITAGYNGVYGYSMVRTFNAHGVSTSDWVSAEPSGFSTYASQPSTVAMPDGGFEVSWDDGRFGSTQIQLPPPWAVNQYVPEGEDSWAQRFNAKGSPLDSYLSDSVVHIDGSLQYGLWSDQYAGESASLTTDTVAAPLMSTVYATYLVNGQRGFDEGYDILVSLQAPGGAATPTPIVVASTFDSSSNRRPDPIDPNFRPMAVALAGGGFAVVFWRDLPHAQGQTAVANVSTVVFDAGGNTVSGEIGLATVVAGNQHSATNYGGLVAPLKSGGFAVAYLFYNSNSNPTGFPGLAVALVDATGALQQTLVIVPPAGATNPNTYGFVAAPNGKLYLSVINFPNGVGGVQVVPITVK